MRNHGRHTMKKALPQVKRREVAESGEDWVRFEPLEQNQQVSSLTAAQLDRSHRRIPLQVEAE